jgi:hypothetical protein
MATTPATTAASRRAVRGEPMTHSPIDGAVWHDGIDRSTSATSLDRSRRSAATTGILLHDDLAEPHAIRIFAIRVH